MQAYSPTGPGTNPALGPDPDTNPEPGQQPTAKPNPSLSSF